MFKAVASGELAKEALTEVFKWLAQHEGKTLHEAIQSLGLKMLSEKELEEIVEKTIRINKETVEKYRKESFHIIVSSVMREVRGRANPEKVIEIIKKKLEK